MAMRRAQGVGGADAGPSEITLRVEAGGYRGHLRFSDRRAVDPASARSAARQTGRGVISLRALSDRLLALSIGGLLLARYNIRNGRGDRRGATRIALVPVGTTFAAWVLARGTGWSRSTEFGHFSRTSPSQLPNAGILWLTYVALEPYVRRYSPRS
jgi:hypothetical protein